MASPIAASKVDILSALPRVLPHEANLISLRLYAITIVALSVIQAAVHASLGALQTLKLMMIVPIVPIVERGTSFEIFTKAKTFFVYARDDASFGLLIFHSILDPERVIHAAFPAQERVSAEAEMRPASYAELEPPIFHPADSLLVGAPIQPGVSAGPLFHSEEELSHCPVTVLLEPPHATSSPAEEISSVLATFHSEESAAVEDEQVIDWHNSGEVSVPDAVISQAPKAILTSSIAQTVVDLPPLASKAIDPYLAIAEPSGYGKAVDEMILLLKNVNLLDIATEAQRAKHPLMKAGQVVAGYELPVLKFIECIVRNKSARENLCAVSKFSFLRAQIWKGFLNGDGKKMES